MDAMAATKKAMKKATKQAMKKVMQKAMKVKAGSSDDADEEVSQNAHVGLPPFDQGGR